VTTHLFFDHLLLPEGWVPHVRLTIAHGLITAITPHSTLRPQDEHHEIALPGLPNLHSHTFQRAFAGLTETRTNPADSFWSWREQMYRFGLRMNPDDVEAAATHAFIEMLEAGFTSVAEFHYLHHDPNGEPYSNIAELSTRAAAAAATAGIDLLLLPVFYAHSNFGGLPPTAGQRRFICTLDQFAALHEKCQALAPTGIAPHSLRAVTPEELFHLLALAKNNPFHLHISEQVQEVLDCTAWSGARPIEWLLSHAPVSPHWCLIHATHANPQERAGIEATGAVVGLCPITEANLGDGIFHTQSFTGNYGFGTDSNVLISVAQEIRQLEYAQRLMARARNVLASDHVPATATAVLQRAVAGGAQALGSATSGLQIGAAANIVTLNTQALGPAAQNPESALNLAVFAARAPAIGTVWVRGRKLVMDGQHLHAAPARQKFNAVVAKLR
jgi:formimidoylglutamate deiminase